MKRILLSYSHLLRCSWIFLYQNFFKGQNISLLNYKIIPYNVKNFSCSYLWNSSVQPSFWDVFFMNRCFVCIQWTWTDLWLTWNSKSNKSGIKVFKTSCKNSDIKITSGKSFHLFEISEMDGNMVKRNPFINAFVPTAKSNISTMVIPTREIKKRCFCVPLERHNLIQ